MFNVYLSLLKFSSGLSSYSNFLSFSGRVVIGGEPSDLNLNHK